MQGRDWRSVCIEKLNIDIDVWTMPDRSETRKGFGVIELKKENGKMEEKMG